MVTTITDAHCNELLALYLHFLVSALKSVKRVKGIEPS